MTDAELKVASACVDADGSGDVSFSEFYAWYTGTDGGGGSGYGDVGGNINGSVVGEMAMMSDVESQGQQSRRKEASTTPDERSRSNLSSSPGRRSAGMKGGLKSAARTTFVKVHIIQ